MSTFHSLCPVVRDESMTLFERVEVDGRARFLPITKRILWLRESNTKLVLRHDGVEVDDRSSFNDWYGFLTSLTGTIIDDAKSLAERFKVGPGDRLSVDLDVTVTDRPAMEDTSPDARQAAERWAGQRYRKSYVSVPSEYGGSRWHLSDVVGENGCWPPRLEPVGVAAVTAIYSTARHPVGVVPPDVAAWVAEQRRAAGVGV